MDPFDQTAPWSMESIRGCAKFLDRVWNLQTILIDGNEYSAKFEQMMHRAIKIQWKIKRNCSNST